MFTRTVVNRQGNPNIWNDQLGNVKDMTSQDPSGYKNEDGLKIASVTQLGTFLPKTSQKFGIMVHVLWKQS